MQLRGRHRVDGVMGPVLEVRDRHRANERRECRNAKRNAWLLHEVVEMRDTHKRCSWCYAGEA